MKKFIQNILEAGIYPDLPEAEKKRLRLLNSIVFIVVFLMPPLAVIDIINGFYITLPFYLFLYLVAFIEQMLVKKRKYTEAKYVIFFLSLVTTMTLLITVGNIYSLYFLVPMAMIPLLVFQSRKVALALFFLVLICYPAIYILMQYIKPAVVLDTHVLILYSIIGSIFITVVIFLLTSYSRSINESYEKIILEKNEEISVILKDITDSITYAKRIQHAKLPKKEEIYSALPQSFVLYKPKEIVSGDFYFFHCGTDLKSVQPGTDYKSVQQQQIFIAAADCTGHGVPGAFMSMIGSEKLQEAVSQTSDTSEILSCVNRGIKNSLHQSEGIESTRDGMDIALVCLTPNHSPHGEGNRTLHYAGANRPFWLIRNGQAAIEEIKATKKAIGGFTDDNQHFESHEIKLQQGDTFYIFSDGYADMFGASGKKLMTKKFKEILLEIQNKTMQEQEKYLNDFAESWKAGTEQVDDILVIGVRL